MTRTLLAALAAVAAGLVFIPSASAQVPPDACLNLGTFELDQATILGTPGNDVIRGTDGPDVIVGG